MLPNPLITIYIPTFNRLPLLKRAIHSVLTQSYTNIELIVVDDGSNDGTHQYIQSLCKTESRIRYYVNKVNSGACVSRNKAISTARGEFITGLDDDDFFLPDRLSQFVASWPSEDGVLATYTDAQIKYSENNLRDTARPLSVTLNEIVISNYIGNQIFCRTETLRQINAFNPNIKIWQDLDCWIRLLTLSGAKAKKIGTATYLIDKSHAHESITVKNQSKAIDSYHHIVREARLNSRNAARLKGQLYLYIPNRLCLSEMTKIALKSMSIRTAAKLVKAYTARKFLGLKSLLN